MENRGKRPIGREKHVTGGGGNVEKRGEGLNLGSSKKSASGGGIGFGGSGGSGGGRTTRSTRAGALKISPILLIAIIAIVYFVMYKGGGGSTSINPSSLIGSQPQAQAQTQAAAADLGELDTSVSSKARAKRGIDSSNPDVTVMIFMLATDLEARGGAATKDLQEMMNATISDGLNIIVYTGGATQWKNSTISATTNQIYKVTSKGLTVLESDLGSKSMVDPSTLSGFIRYCKSNFPAGRYELILWDHGGGSLAGYGYDMKYPNDAMTLDEVAQALKDGGTNFDIIGFDACLMATLETALAIEPYADYILASEETEPGDGWYYTNWITTLNANKSMSTLELGKKIIDDFISYSPKGQSTTLSLIDLAELKGTIPDTFKSFAESTSELIKSEQYQTVAQARGNSREFARSSNIGQVDLIQLAQNMGTPEGDEFADALRGAVKYNLTCESMKDSGGISIYFPYNNNKSVDTALQTYDKLELEEGYSECVRLFSNLQLGGQIASNQTDPLGSLFSSLLGSGGIGSSQAEGISSGLDVTSLLGMFLGGGGDMSGLFADRQTPQWVDEELILSQAEYYEKNMFDPSALVFSENAGNRVIKLEEDQWELVRDIELNVYLDDGEGYIELGLDNTFEFDDDGHLIAEYDRTWLAINEQVVSYYFLSMTGGVQDYVIEGRVPALLNGEQVDIMLSFTADNPRGEVMGARLIYQGETDTLAKGLIDIVEGDEIDFICDYYTYDKQFVNNYFIGDTLRVDGELSISNVSVGDNECISAFRFTDIYENKYWTADLGSRG